MMRSAGVRTGVRSCRWLAVAAAVASLAVIGAPAPAAAQVEMLAQECVDAAPIGQALQTCLRAAQALEIGQPRVGLALAGGNPVLGTASTLGFRLRRIPRLTAGLRATAVRVRVPPIEDFDDSPISFFAPAIALDGAIGVLPGVTLLPTVGGVGSLDLLAGASLVPIPAREEFISQTAVSVGIGGRLGLLRESFLAPGVSVSAMYRTLDQLGYGDEALQDSRAFFRADMSGWMLRAAVSKRIVVVGATAGVGRDRYRSNVRFGVRDPTPIPPGQDIRFQVRNFTTRRTTAFVNLSWTAVIFHLVGELGWQSGGDVVPGLRPDTLGVDPESGTLFGSAAVRISI